MRRKILSILILIVLLTLFTSNKNQLSAHFIQANGDIGINMHIDPDDDPIIGELATFYLEFEDPHNVINPTNCDCYVFIIQDGQELFFQSLFSESITTGFDIPSFSYTFPERGLYVIRFTGKPVGNASLEAFTIDYDLRVTRDSASDMDSDASNLNQLSSLFENKTLLTFAVYAVIFIAVTIGIVTMMKRKQNN